MLINEIASQWPGNGICRKLESLLERDTLLETKCFPGFPSSIWQREILQTANLSRLRALVAAYDQSTGAHARRLMYLTESVALCLCLPEDETYFICLAALLHDIGKIFIPAAILHKPGPLNSEEWKIMRSHPEIGSHLLQRAGGIFKALAHLVIAHHERWDGRGYPAGLAGGEIPLGARILAVVDSYDAMTSNRSYQKPLSSAEACEKLELCMGSQYDPRIVTAFLTALKERNVLTVLNERVKQNLVIGGAESVDAVLVAPLPQSGEYAPLSA